MCFDGDSHPDPESKYDSHPDPESKYDSHPIPESKYDSHLILSRSTVVLILRATIYRHHVSVSSILSIPTSYTNDNSTRHAKGHYQNHRRQRGTLLLNDIERLARRIRTTSAKSSRTQSSTRRETRCFTCCCFIL